ncbi:acyltransferase [Nocardioides aestuarii]|uniref:Acyltransferase family protein n=1 Tax=Nocardioides aestuarii TaxID=252231 RepID=A0ABW4TMW6_9ACTN
MTSGDRLAYITGLRGIAALVVAVGHLLGMVPPDHPATSVFGANAYHLAIWPWLFGGQAVWLFLMVSGFALYWSEMRRRDAGRGATPLRVYALRRFWRIAPTYYAAVALGTVVLLVGSSVYLAPSPSLDTLRPVTPGGVVSHLLFVHNLNVQWIYQISPPLWSIGVEVHLYLLFPLLVRWHNPIVPACLLVVAVRALQYALDLPVFALAEFFLAGAVLSHVAERWRPIPGPLLWATALTFMGLGFVRLDLPGPADQLVWLIGFGTLLLALHQASAAERGNVTTWPTVQRLGDASYSLYAVHFPLALALWWGVGRLGLPHAAEAAVMVVLGLPLVLAATWGCYRWVETWSLGKVRDVGRVKPAPAEVLGG